VVPLTVPPPQEFRAPAAVLPKDAYTPWSTRLLAFLIDWSPIWLVVLVPMIGLLAAGDLECIDNIYGSGGSYCSIGASRFWGAVQFVAFLPAAAYYIWNFCYRQGRTGQSIGKSVMKFAVVSEKTWQPIGFWMSLVRQIAHYIDQLICYIGYLWPLWDPKRQTIADKIMSTVCVPVQRNALTPVNDSPITS
jgi:uncharacterized RDD family membrane protein YckC